MDGNGKVDASLSNSMHPLNQSLVLLSLKSHLSLVSSADGLFTNVVIASGSLKPKRYLVYRVTWKRNMLESMGAFSHSARTARAQRHLLRCLPR